MQATHEFDPRERGILTGINRCPDYRSRIIVGRKRGFLYCPVPKVANTNWKFLLAETVPDDIGKLHSRELSGFEYLSSLSGGGSEPLGQELFKFIFVRDPFSRILSAYRNKIENAITRIEQADRFDGWKLLARYIKHRVEELGLRDTAEENVSFREFVLFLYHSRPEDMNEHWHPQALLACVGEIEYDFVGKFESLLEDSEVVIKRLGIQRGFPSHEEVRFAPTRASDLIDVYYTGETRDLIREKYDADFAAFGY